MKQDHRRHRSWFIFPLALLLLGVSPAAGAQGPAEVIPPPDPLPVQVRLGLTIIDFAHINNREETFDVHGYLEARWVDKRLKRVPPTGPNGRSEKMRKMHASRELWTPQLSFMNAVEEVKVLSRTEIYADDEGNVFQGLDFTGKFATPLDLRRFPFDSQLLQILIQPTDAEKSEITLVAGDSPSGVLEEAFLSDWDVGKSTAYSKDYVYRSDKSNYSTFVSETHIKRRSRFTCSVSFCRSRCWSWPRGSSSGST